MQIPPQDPESAHVRLHPNPFAKLLRSIFRVKEEGFGFDKDHLNMVMSIQPKYSISSVIGKLKDRSTNKIYWDENITWSPGYHVSREGVDEETVRRDVEHQGARIRFGFV